MKAPLICLFLLLLLPVASLAQVSEQWKTDPEFWNGHWWFRTGCSNPWETRPVKGELISFWDCYNDDGHLKGRIDWREGVDWIASGRMEFDPQTMSLQLTSSSNSAFDTKLEEVTWADQTLRDTIVTFREGADSFTLEKCAKPQTSIEVFWPQLIFKPDRDSLLADTSSIPFQVIIKSGGGVGRVMVRTVVSRYDWIEGQGYSLLPGNDTLMAVDTVLRSVDSFLGDTLRFELSGKPQGSVVEYQLGILEEDQYPWLFGSRQYRVYPMRGKAGPSLTPVSVADIMRLVYVILGFTPPRMADYLGLELNGSGTFSDEDIWPLLELWRRPTVDK